jgi:hypothetical protein
MERFASQKCMTLLRVTMNNLRQPAEPKREVVECAIVELLEIAKRQGIAAADFIQLLDSGMQIPEFLAAMTSHYCWICDHEVSLETCKIDEHGSAVYEACLFARMKMETTSLRFGASRGFGAADIPEQALKFVDAFITKDQLSSHLLTAIVRLQEC